MATENNRTYVCIDVLLANLAELYIVGIILATIAFGCLDTSDHYIARSALKGLVWPYSVVQWNLTNG